jgi:Zn finger protein HypA/HybF involved in hydrogenase expression
MHEVNLVKQIIEKVGDGEVKSITLEIGELMDHEPKDITETLESMSGWKVDYVERKGLVKCECGYRGTPKILEKSHGVILFICPKCSKTPKVLEGDGVKILKVE